MSIDQNKRRKNPHIAALTLEQVNERFRDYEARISQLEGIGADADMHGRRIVNLGDDSQDRDAINKRKLVFYIDERVDPVDAALLAQFLILTEDSGLPNSRIFTIGHGLNGTDSGAGLAYTLDVDETELDHNLFQNLSVGDVHTHYLLLAGRTGGQIAKGGIADGETFALLGSAHASSGPITLNANLIVDANGDLTLQKSADSADIIQIVYADSGVGTSTYCGKRAGGTLASPTGAPSGGALMTMEAFGHDGVSAFHKSGVAAFTATELHSATVGGTQFKVMTMLTGGVSIANRLLVDGSGNLLINASGSSSPTSMLAGLAIKSSTPPVAVAADVVALYTGDARGQAGQSFWHAMGENDCAYLLSGMRFTDASGSPIATGAHEGAWEYNLADNALYAYLEAAWHGIVLADSTNYVDLTDAGATTLHKHDHGGQDGLADDDHVGYARLTGRAGGQVWTAGIDAGDDLTLSSTVHATKGNIHLGALSTFDEVNNFLGIGTLTPENALEGVSDGSTTCLAARAFYNGATGCGVRAYRARGTKAAPRRIQSGDVIGVNNSIGAYAADDVTDAVFATASGQFKYLAAENYTSTAMGTDWQLNLAPIGSVTPVEVIRFLSSGHMRLPELTANPGTADLAADAAIAFYTKADKLVFAYNNGGTMTYITLDLDGSDITWTHSTSAP